MRVVIQRVQEASVKIEGEISATIQQGLLVLIGICEEDTYEDVQWLVNKIVQQRIFSDKDGKMNLSVQDLNGELLLVSQFTLFASTKKGNRPSFTGAAKPSTAIPLYELFITECCKLAGENKVSTGVFGADMKVSLVNDGPVTILMDSKIKE